MMQFQVVKNALVSILETDGADIFRVINNQRQGYDANDLESINNTVQVFYDSGSFPKSVGSYNLEVKHNATYRLEMMVASKASGDLSVLNDEMATDLEREQAINSIANASANADTALDNLFMNVYQILMAARNIDLGLLKFDVSTRWIENFTKDKPSSRGQLVVLTGWAEYTCSLKEDLQGLETNPLLVNEIENTELGAESGVRVNY